MPDLYSLGSMVLLHNGYTGRSLIFDMLASDLSLRKAPSQREAVLCTKDLDIFETLCDRDPLARNFKNFKFFKNSLKNA